MDSTLTTKTENRCNSVDEKRQERQNKLKEQRMAREQKRLEQQQKRKERREKENEMPKMNMDSEGSQSQSSRNLLSPQINGHEGTWTVHDSYDNNIMYFHHICSVILYWLK